MGGDPGGLIVRPVRRDSLADAAGVAAVLNAVIAEGGRTILTGCWSPEAELAFLAGLGPRSELLVAEIEGEVVGFQVIEPFPAYSSALDHVAVLGTYVRAGARRCGVGQRLAAETFRYARAHGYEKAVIYVLAGNAAGLAYYEGLGFQRRGTLTRQARIDRAYHDEVLLEILFPQGEGDREMSA